MKEDSDEKKLRLVEDEVDTEESEYLLLGSESGEVVRRLRPDKDGAAVDPKPEEMPGMRSAEPTIDAIMDDELGEQTEWELSLRKGPVPYGWFLLVFILIGGLAALSVSMVLSSRKGEGNLAKKVATERLESDAEDYAEAEALVESVEATLARYVAAASSDDLLPLVRDPERVAPLIANWYAERPFVPRKFDRLGVFQPMDLGKRPFWLITCEVEGGPPETVLMEQTGDGRVLVDWETQVCYQPMDWNRYVKDRPECGAYDFRVYVQPDYAGFFSHEFGDEDKWSVYRLTAKDSDEYLFGYVRKGTALASELLEFSGVNHGRPVALLLTLRTPEGVRSPRGVLIEKVVSRRWALVEPGTTAR